MLYGIPHFQTFQKISSEWRQVRDTEFNLHAPPAPQILACESWTYVSPLLAQKRRLLASAAAAGISVAFGSPLGGVLFGLEELDTFANDSEVIWRGFATSAVAAFSLQYINPFGTSKLVLFDATSGSDVWRGFELVCFIWLIWIL